MKIEARLLGEFRVEVEGQPIPRFRTRTTALLLAYLLRYPQRHSREQLLRLFWKGVPKAAARNNLRVTLSSLRQQLEPPGVPKGWVLQSDRHTVGLNPDLVQTDVALFEDALQRAGHASTDEERQQLLEYACALYRGDFLAGFEEPWVQTERERLRQLYQEALHQLRYAEPSASTSPRTPTLTTLSNPPSGLGIVLGLESETPLERYRAWARQVINASGGFVLEASTTSLRAFFPSLEGLLKALDTLHAQLKAARFALDVGEVRYGLGRYGGKPLTMVGQLLQAGSTRQILCTERAALLLPQARATTRFALHPLGCYRLSERSSNEQVYQLDFAGREQRFAPLRALSPLRPALPRVPTSFIGRDVELAQLQAWLQSSEGQLITVVGAPGVGKSRLVLECAWRTEPLFGEARWWVKLHHADESLSENWARCLGWEWRGVNAFLQSLQAAIGEQPALLALDAGAALAPSQQAELIQLRTTIPSLHCLIAAQMPLGVPEEQLFWLEPLPVPPEGAEAIDELLRYAAARLFVERAQRAAPDFRLTARNASLIAALCRQLSGLPLAIELAAARVGSIDLGILHAQLKASLMALRGRPFGTFGHSLEASLQATYQLLSKEAQILLARLSVFRGGFSLDGAQAVAPSSNARSALEELTRVSLVQWDGHRYQMLEPVRLFAEEALHALGDQDQTRTAHLNYYLNLATQWGDKAENWVLLEEERANCEAALEWGVEQAPIHALQLVLALAPFWEGCGSGESTYRLVMELPQRLDEMFCLEGDNADMLSPLQGSVPAPPPLSDIHDSRLQAARVAISLAIRRGEMEKAGELLTRYLPLAAEHSDSVPAARIWIVAGFYYWMQGHFEQSIAYLERAIAICRERDAPLDRAEALIHLGVAFWIREDLRAAIQLFEEALELLPPDTAPRLRLNALGNLANTLYQLGHYEQAEACLKETLRLAQRLGDRRTVATLLNNWGVWLRNRGEYHRARELYLQSMAIWRELHEGMGEAVILNNLADLAMQEGDHETARTTFLQSVEKAQRSQLGWYLYHPLRNLAELAEREGDLTTAQQWMRRALHACLKHHPAARAAPLLRQLAHYTLQSGQADEAARWLLLASQWTDNPATSDELRITAASLISPESLQLLQQEIERLTVPSVLQQLEQRIAQEDASGD
ncbi:Putative HTH-type transcriptional regulator [bacterium HR15]|nr:Putative HTH-type transcriptional regulator [bacterium HR15]